MFESHRFCHAAPLLPNPATSKPCLLSVFTIEGLTQIGQMARRAGREKSAQGRKGDVMPVPIVPPSRGVKQHIPHTRRSMHPIFQRRWDLFRYPTPLISRATRYGFARCSTSQQSRWQGLLRYQARRTCLRCRPKEVPPRRWKRGSPYTANLQLPACCRDDRRASWQHAPPKRRSLWRG